ncbi:radical SAM protein [bacterium]|nr:radical SAM protein [bacterium]
MKGNRQCPSAQTNFFDDRIALHHYHNQTMVLDYDNGVVIKFNEVGSFIWDLFASPITIKEVAQLIATEYEVSVDDALQDVLSFVTKYQEENNLFISPDQTNVYSQKKKRLDESIYGQLEEIGFEYTIPVMVEIELTNTCNLRCIHCSVIYNSQRTNIRRMTTSEIYSVIDQLEAIGCFEITFTGGEIFTRGDTLDIIRYADQKGFGINLLSTATLLSQEQLDELAKLTLNNFQVSIYGPTADIHDSVTRISGSFNKSLKNIHALISRGVHVTLACVVMNINYSTYQDVQQLAKNIGADCTIGYPIRARDDGNPDTHELRLSHEELHHLVRSNQSRFCKSYKKDLDAPICHAGRVIASISSEGDVFPCILFPMRVGNLIKSDFEHIWNNSPELVKYRNLQLKDTYACKDCSLLEHCPICPGLALLEEGDMLAPAQINCDIAHSISTVL